MFFAPLVGVPNSFLVDILPPTQGHGMPSGATLSARERDFDQKVTPEDLQRGAKNSCSSWVCLFRKPRTLKENQTNISQKAGFL